MQNGMANGLWKKALKTAISSVSAVIVVQFADPGQVIWTRAWFIHLGLQVAALLIFNEAVYWRNWADAPNGNGDVKKND